MIPQTPEEIIDLLLHNKICSTEFAKKQALSALDAYYKDKFKQAMPTGEELHKLYLEATSKLNPESYNQKAQKVYSELTDEQKFIDNFIAQAIHDKVMEKI